MRATTANSHCSTFGWIDNCQHYLLKNMERALSWNVIFSSCTLKVEDLWFTDVKAIIKEC